VGHGTADLGGGLVFAQTLINDLPQGEALAEIGGVECKIHFFAVDLPHSDACIVQAYPAETTEAFCDGHNAAFSFFGGVPKSILYDNLNRRARPFSPPARGRISVPGTDRRSWLFRTQFSC
jgi:hypothetical protein